MIGRDGALDCVHELVAEAIDALDCPPGSCGHLVDGGLGQVCSRHPEQGVRCEPCASRHADSHPVVVEHGCDGCGSVEPELWPLSCPVGTMPISNGRVFVYVVCLGLCDRCRPRTATLARGVG